MLHFTRGCRSWLASTMHFSVLLYMLSWSLLKSHYCDFYNLFRRLQTVSVTVQEFVPCFPGNYELPSYIEIMSDDNRPTMKDLDPELKGLVRWKKFAVHLPMLEQSDIEEIEQDNRGSTENQKLAVLGVWLRKCVSASWLDVVYALEKIDEKSLADYIKVKHCPVTSFLPSSSSGSYHRKFR